ncbi:MAG: right-handed parallel beta-helix repeat-containing protein [Chthoniobacteraceae bacterium]|jgi:hypothetical protein
MKYHSFFIIILASLVFAPPAFCQATRTWVSGVGDDANPGSRTAPCKTYAGAISKTAVGGEIDNLDTGGFGAVTITKSITIDGASGIASSLVIGTNGIVVATSGAMEVTLRNLLLTGQGGGLGGLVVNGGGSVILHVENCKIFGFTSHGIDFEPSGASALYVKDCHIYNNAGDGLYLKPGAASLISITDSVIDGNAIGVHGDVNTTTVVDGTKSAGNNGAGFETVPGAIMTISGGESSANGTGISSSGTMAISDVTVTGNGEGLNYAPGGQIQSFGNNPIGANAVATEDMPTSKLPLR